MFKQNHLENTVEGFDVEHQILALEPTLVLEGVLTIWCLVLKTRFDIRVSQMEARSQSGKEFWGEKGANSIPFVTRVVDWHSKAVLLYKLNIDFFFFSRRGTNMH